MSNNRRESDKSDKDNSPSIKPPPRHKRKMAGISPTTSTKKGDEVFDGDTDLAKTGSGIDVDTELKKICDCLKNLKGAVGHVENGHAQLNDSVHGEGGVDEQLEGMQYLIDELIQARTAFKENQKSYTYEIVSLKGIVKKQSEELSIVRAEVDDLRNRSFSNNIVIHNVPEIKDSETDLETTAKNALTKAGYDIMNVKFDKLHRIGSFSNGIKDIVAKPHYFKDKDRLLSKTLTREQKNGPWISPPLY